MPAILIAFLILSPTTRDESLVAKVAISLFVFVILGLILYFAASRALQRLSELSVSMFPDKLERESRKHKEIFSWKDIQRVDILEYPNGEVASVKLTLADKKAINLFGFDDMGTAIEQIEALITDDAIIRKKRMKLDWDRPIIMILTSLLTLAIILGIQEIGEQAYRFFNVVFFFSFGCFNLVFRPISRAQGIGWKLFETIIGSVLIVCSILILAIEIFLR